MTAFLTVFVEAMPDLLDGLLVSLKLSALSLTVGLPGGLLFAVLQISGNRLTKTVAVVLVEAGRGAPALVILYLAYFGLPELGLVTSATTAAVAGLGYSSAAYTSEMFRSALKSVPASQREAATVIGLNAFDQFRFVDFPQAIRIAIPPVMSFAIVLFQGTSLCFVIAVPEMLSRAYNYASMTFQYLPVLTLAGLIYAVVAISASLVVARLEKRLSSHLSR